MKCQVSLAGALRIDTSKGQERIATYTRQGKNVDGGRRDEMYSFIEGMNCIFLMRERRN